VSDPYRALFESSPHATLILSGDRVLEANDAAAELLGRAAESLRRARVAELFRGAGLDEALAQPAARHGEWISEPRRLEWALSEPLSGEVRALVLCDVTAHHRRAELWERYRLVSESAHDIVLFIRRDGSIFEANEAAAHAYGYARAELLTMNVRDLRAPATREQVVTQMREAFERGALFETLHLRRDGSTFPVEVSSRAAVVTGEPVLLSIVRDVTERSAMQARLLQADRMAAVGTLAAGVAHEINNPLAYALTNLEVLARTLARMRTQAGPADWDLAEQLLSIAREGADRVRAIVRDLKTFSRADDAQRGPVDVRHVLDSCINMASAELRHRARILREYADVPAIEASESRIAQVFLNLLVNAAQSFSDSDPRHHEIRVRTLQSPDGEVVVEVSDNGPGIPPSLRARIFEPFVTSKPVGEGTGLGLFISHEIVAALGGRIDVESEPSAGTCMRVTLPPADAAARSSSQPLRPLTAVLQRRRILVVDDEDSIGVSIRRAIEDETSVVVATSGQEALALLEGDRAFDIVLCDVVMPEMDGLELYQAVAGLDAMLAARFLFMTGGALTAEARAALVNARGRLLEKPFTVDELRRELARRW